jgi:predicted metal-dependent phosphoesterase TrpH
MSQLSIISKADLHLHTTASDGSATVEQLLDHVARQTDLRVIAVTDHDTLNGALVAQELVARYDLPVEVIVGEEVSSTDGHIIGLWLRELVPPGLSAAETVAAIHAQGGLAFAAHPFFRSRQPSRPGAPRAEGVGRLVRHVAFDAIEVINGTPCLQLANLLARRFNDRYTRLPEIGASDAHILPAIGKSYTLFPGARAADLRRALERGSVMAARGWYRPAELVAYAAFYMRLTRAQRATAA